MAAVNKATIAAVRRYVNQFNVGEPDSHISGAIRDKVQDARELAYRHGKKGATKAQEKMLIRIGLEQHHKNQGIYSHVMSGGHGYTGKKKGPRGSIIGSVKRWDIPDEFHERCVGSIRVKVLKPKGGGDYLVEPLEAPSPAVPGMVLHKVELARKGNLHAISRTSKNQRDPNYYRVKDRLFDLTKQTGRWPALLCRKCQTRGGCCKYAYHHVGDCCIHCGNDERKLRRNSRRR